MLNLVSNRSNVLPRCKLLIFLMASIVLINMHLLTQIEEVLKKAQSKYLITFMNIKQI